MNQITKIQIAFREDDEICLQYNSYISDGVQYN